MVTYSAQKSLTGEQTQQIVSKWNSLRSLICAVAMSVFILFPCQNELGNNAEKSLSL